MGSRARRYLNLKGRTWWFKRDIPAAIRIHFENRTAYLQSLATGDIRVAQERRDELARETDWLFRDLRDGRATPRRSTIEELAELWATELTESRRDPLGWTERTHGRLTSEEDAVDASWLVEEVAERIGREHGEAGQTKFLNIVHGRVAVDHHLEDHLREAGLAPKTISGRRGLVRQFATWANSQGLTLPDINRSAAGRYVTECVAGRHRRTGKKHVSSLKAYWDYLIRRGHVKAPNPWVDQLEPDRGRRMERGGRDAERPFTSEEMRKLLYAPFPVGMTASWEALIHDAMRIAALSGMRLAETISLRVGDCSDGAFRVEEGKTKAAIRQVPIHKALRDIVSRRRKGKQASDLFFHEMATTRNPGDTFGKRFRRYRIAVGVDDAREDRRRGLVNFHSFRRWFITEAERAGQPVSTISTVVGHTEGRRSIAFGVYSAGPSEDQRRACVEAVQLPMPISTS